MRTFLSLGARVGALVLAWGAVAPLCLAGTTIDVSHKFSYGANVGWSNWRGDTDHGAVFTSKFASGYVYSANTGWMSLGDGRPANGVSYGNSSVGDWGVNVDDASDPNYLLLSGYAYSANCGWVNFSVAAAAGDANRPRIEKSTGILRGYAWGANIGWLSLSSPPDAIVVTTLDPALTATPSPTPVVTPMPTPTPGPPGMVGAQSFLIMTDWRAYAAVFDITGGETLGYVDGEGLLQLDYELINMHWLGAYIYDYNSASWVKACHVYPMVLMSPPTANGQTSSGFQRNEIMSAP